MSEILVVGSVALDSVKTPYGEAVDALGGSASYFSFSASHFAPVRIVAVMGEDFPEEHRRTFRARGVDLSGLQSTKDRTFRWRRKYEAELGHAHTLETQLNVFSTFHPELGPVHRACPFVFLANIDPELQLEVLDQMTKPQLSVSDTMNYWIARSPERVMDVMRRVDVALLNEEEARALSGETQLMRATARLIELGAKAVIVKKGEHGSLYRSRDELFLIPAFPVGGLQDPTGAGDSFAGGFLGWLARSGSLEPPVRRQAMAFGTAMASLAIEAFSPARLVAAQGEEIARRVATLHRMVDFELEKSFP